MKKLFSIFAFMAVAATALVSCTETIDNQIEVVDGVRMKTITVQTGIETRTTLDADHENLIWSAGDSISIFNNIDDTNLKAIYAAGEYITVTVPEATTDIYAHYPYYHKNTGGPDSVSIYIPNKQTQTNPGQLNGNYFPMVAKGTVSADNKALISLYPVAGALALNLYHTGLSGSESVSSVKVTVSNTGIVGSQITDITADRIQYTTPSTDGPVTVTLTNPLALGNTKPANKQTFAGQIYVCLAKQSYSNVRFEIVTDKGVYTITSNNTPFDLENNDFVPVNINLSKAHYDGPVDPVNPTDFSWTLVKDALSIGDKVVIAAAGYDFALSVTQNSNNRGQIAVTKSGTTLTANENVQVFEVVAGSVNNSVSFRCVNGDQNGKYIAAASSSNNYLHSNSTVDDNASWSVTINTNTGVASVVAQGSYERNTLKYNSNSDNSLFSCYASSNTMKDVVFYRAGLPSANLSFPKASYSVNLGETFTAPTLNNPHSVTVTYNSSDSNVATVDATGIVTIVAAGTTTITASFAGNSSYIAGEASYELNVVDPSVERWVKTSIADIATSDVFVIVGDGYAVTNNNGTSSAPAAASVTIANNALSAIPAANLRWKLSGNATSGYSFSPASDATKFLYCNTNAESGSNNNIRVGTGARKLWQFNSNGIMMTKDDKVVRYFSKYENSDWRGYISTSNGAVALEFYVKQGGGSTPVPTKLVMGVISCTDSGVNENSLSWSWSAVGNATGYQISENGSTFGSTQTALNYTRTGLVAGQSYTIWVKAIGDGTNYSDSDAVESASGTTKTSGSSTSTTVSSSNLGSASTTFTSIDDEISYKNSASNTYSNPMRIYANNTFTIKANSKNIITVVYGCNSESYANVLSTSTFTVDSGASCSVSRSGSDVIVTITGSSKSLVVKVGAQVRLDSLSVTYN